MIYGFLHQGSGLGNQLHRLVATKVRALDLGVGWDMIYHPDGSGKESGFKGESFMDIGWNSKSKTDIQYTLLANRPITELNIWNEKSTRDENSGVDIRSYDPEFNFVEDNTIIDGEFQDERYWEHLEKEVDEWLKVEPLAMPEDLCVIGFRGGEYAIYPDLFLDSSYWLEAIKKMKAINPQMRFIIHTDDPQLAVAYFKELGYDFAAIHDIGINWRSMRYAKYAIIANSSFFILPRWLRNGITIAPRYWARHNTKIWALPQNYYNRFTYI